MKINDLKYSEWFEIANKLLNDSDINDLINLTFQLLYFYELRGEGKEVREASEKAKKEYVNMLKNAEDDLELVNNKMENVDNDDCRQAILIAFRRLVVDETTESGDQSKYIG